MTVKGTVKEKVNPKAGCMGIAISIGVLLFCSSMITILLAVAIWPGEAKLTAPFLCPSDQPDHFVVVDSYSSEPGETSYNFTLYCVGERGDYTDAGFGLPFFVLWGYHTILLLGLLALLAVRAAIKRRRRADDAISPKGLEPTAPASVGADPTMAPTPELDTSNLEGAGSSPVESTPVDSVSPLASPQIADVVIPDPAPPTEPDPPLPPGPIS